MKKIPAVAALAIRAGCSNPQQQQAVTTAVIDAGSCIVTVAPSIVQVAGGSADNTSKAIAAGGVAVAAVTTVQPCKDAPAAIAAAVQAGKTASVVPTSAPAAPKP